jgi:uroporphyrinogen decarboxylase
MWLMRQAGRYLPEYRTARASVRSFLDACLNPELAARLTLQPIDRFDLDAAILFSDILIVPFGLGRQVEFVEGEGPRLEPIDADGIARLDVGGFGTRVQPVLDAMVRVRAALGRDKSLIGFCGAPWTVATYMVAGQGSVDQAATRLMAKREPAIFQGLIDILTEVSSQYLIEQARAGADVVQIFDSWAGVLDDVGFARWSIEPTRKIVSAVRAAAPATRVIGFPKGAGLRLEAYIEGTEVDGVGIDWMVPLAYARERLQPRVAVQGNLDPLTLVAGGAELDGAVDRILAALHQGRFIFNLGHGIVPETPVAHVERLVKRVRAHG